MKKRFTSKNNYSSSCSCGMGYFVFTNYVSKEKDLVFEARIKEVTVNNNIYTVLVEEYDKKKKRIYCRV